jgi:hypothetical protein
MRHRWLGWAIQKTWPWCRLPKHNEDAVCLWIFLNSGGGGPMNNLLLTKNTSKKQSTLKYFVYIFLYQESQGATEFNYLYSDHSHVVITGHLTLDGMTRGEAPPPHLHHVSVLSPDQHHALLPDDGAGKLCASSFKI